MIDLIPVWMIIASLALLGAVGGSFAGAQVWRLRARQLHDDSLRLKALSLRRESGRTSEEEAEYSFLRQISGSVSSDEKKRLAPLIEVSTKTDRSRCLSCRHQLAWYDLVPGVSWLSTGGRCRYCRSRIGWFEIMIEVGLAVFFVLSYLLWPYNFDGWMMVAAFVVWLLASVALAVLFAYDSKWYLLPDVPMDIFRILALVYAGLILVSEGVTLASIASVVGAVAAIGGLYWVLHAVSKGTWVGYGDVRLGVGLGLLLVEWPVAVLAVVLANTIGTLLILPALIAGRLERQSQIPFGPLLIVGAVLAHWWGQGAIDWYMTLL